MRASDLLSFRLASTFSNSGRHRQNDGKRLLDDELALSFVRNRAEARAGDMEIGFEVEIYDRRWNTG